MAAKAAMILLRGAPRSLLVGMLFLLGESRFVCGAGTSGWFSSLLNRQRFRDELPKAALGCLAISQLTACVARDNSNCAFLAES